MTTTVSKLKQQLLQLDELHTSGALSEAKYKEGRADLERRLVDLVLQGDAGDSTTGQRAGTRKGGAAKGDKAGLAVPASSQDKLSPGMLAGLFAGVLVLAIAGYMWKGSPSRIDPASAAVSGAQEQGDAGQPHSFTAEQISAMADKLAARLQEKPDDVEGWAMLARSYSVLGRHPEALKAYEKAVALRSDDAQLLADYADSMAMKNNSSLSGEPTKLIEKALKVDPRNLKALALAGTAAFDRKDYAGAIKYWEQVVALAPPDSNYGQQVQAGIAEARQLGGLASAGAPAKASAGAAPLLASGKTLGGTVSLSPALAKMAAPDDTVFVFARSAEGRGMPLAIIRKKVRDLPFQFTLDDSLSMSPAALLSGASMVVVGARVSKSGNAVPQNGDLTTQTPPIPLGDTSLKLEIRDVVKQ